jgi:adenosine deaminase
LELSEDETIFTEEVFRLVVRGLLDELATSQVEHADLRIGPSVGRWRWMGSAADGMSVFRDELTRYNNVSIAFLAGINMTKSVQQLDAIFKTLVDDAEVASSIAGVDVNFLPGDMLKFYRYLPMLCDLQRSGLKVNVHLGELFDNSISRQVLSRIIPDRIGHGVLLLRDPELTEMLRHHEICLDMCPTSNTRLGVVDWALENPARQALNQGIPVSINTDDPLLFNTTIDTELRLAGLSDDERDAVIAYSRKHRYAPA